MKNFVTKKIFSITLFITIATNFAFNSNAQEAVPAYIKIKGKKNAMRCQIVKISSASIHWQELGGNKTQNLPIDQVEEDGIYLEEIKDFKRAKAQTKAKNYAKAEEYYRRVVDGYLENFKSVKNSFANMALFYQIQSLKKSGQLKKIAPAINKIERGMFSEQFTNMLTINQIWLQFRKAEWDGVIRSVESFDSSKASLPELAEIGYLGGIAYLNKNEQVGDNKFIGSAAQYLSQAFACFKGENNFLSKDALTKCLNLYKNFKDLKKNEPRLMEIHGLAQIYREVYNAGENSPEFAEFAKPFDDGSVDNYDKNNNNKSQADKNTEKNSN